MLLARSLSYKPLFAKQKSGVRHINVGELRAALKTEKTLSMRDRSTRQLQGIDSQVALGTLVKGRSSSAAMNAELSRSLPWMLALDSYADYFYYHTSVNRADQPTRGKDIEPPDQALPEWWYELSRGEYQKFDEWLYEHGLDAESMSQLPPLSELCGDVSPEGILPYFLRSSRKTDEPEPLSGFEAAEAETGCLPSSSTSAQPLRRTALSGRDQSSWKQPRTDRDERPASPDDAVGGGRPLPTCSTSARLPKQTAIFGRGSPPPEVAGKARSLAPRLTAAAKAALGQFPSSQIVPSPGMTWPPERAGFLDLFSGERGVAKALARHHHSWSLCFDIADGPNQDLDDPELRRQISDMIKLGCFIGLGGGPVCSSFSMAVRPPVRSRSEPYGKTDMTENMRQKVLHGNQMALWFFSVLALGLSSGLAVWMENPNTSWMFKLPEWKHLETSWPELQHWTLDYCRFEEPWRKRTRFYSNTCLGGLRTLCQGGHVHQLLKGYSRKHKCSWTRLAQAYPKGVAENLAKALAMKAGIATRRSFDPGCMAKCGEGRIGEASNPGPRQVRHQPRLGLLEAVPLVEAKTLALQDKIWSGFLRWIKDTLSPVAARSAMSHPLLLVSFVKEYGNFLYSTGRSLYVYRHLVVFIQQNYVSVKPYMGTCWNMISRWELMEPTVHRVPLPYAIFRAMVTVALGWGWTRFVGILALGFLGIARPGEPLAACRGELVLARDMLEEDKGIVYLKIMKPKTRHRGRGVVQHISIQDAEFVKFLNAIYGSRPAEERLLGISPSAFRRRWDAVLSSLLIPRSAGLTPGGVRGGGCVYAFQQGTELPKLLWRMRIKHLQTLESYLQEVAASTVVAELPQKTRERIRCAAALTSVYLAAAATNANPGLT